MKQLALAIVVCTACACSAWVHTSLLYVAPHTTELLHNEQFVSGNFFKLRKYHQNMLEATTQPKAFPYSTLDSLFQIAYKEADTVAMARIEQAPLAAFCDSLQKARKRVSKKSEVYELANIKIAQSAKLLDLSMRNYQAYNQLERAYYNLAKEQGIVSFNSTEYAELLNGKLIQWQDSLEQIGKIIAAEKLDLKSKYPEQKGPEFFSHYALVSQLEAQLKAFDSSIMQLQNSLSRFEGANNEEVYFSGPYIEPRREIMATDGILENLGVAMQACREKQKEYYNSYQ